jgi:hypothetical protein
VIRLEPRIAFGANETLNQQTGARQQYKRERKLRDDGRGHEMLLPCTLRSSSGTLSQAVRNRRFRDINRRCKTKYEWRRQCYSSCKAQDPPVQTDLMQPRQTVRRETE